MSDIGLPGLAWVLFELEAILILGLPLVVGLLLFLLRVWVPMRSGLVTALYFGISIAALYGTQIWLWSWMIDADILYWGLPLAILGSAIDYGLFRLLRMIFRRMRG